MRTAGMHVQEISVHGFRDAKVPPNSTRNPEPQTPPATGAGLLQGFLRGPWLRPLDEKETHSHQKEPHGWMAVSG